MPPENFGFGWWSPPPAPTPHKEMPPVTDDDNLYNLVETLREEVALLRRENQFQYRQVEAMFSLFSVLQPRTALPPLGGWRISPDFAVVLINLLQAYRPQSVLELGGGVSTIITAYALERWNPGEGRVLGLEHQQLFVEGANAALKLHGFGAPRARVVHAPLQPYIMTDEGHDDVHMDWYDLRSVKSVSRIDLLVVDGPPQYGNPQPMARFPALPLLRDRLRRNSLILMDDTKRESEQRIIASWLNQFPVRLAQEYDVEKGAILLEWQAD